MSYRAAFVHVRAWVPALTALALVCAAQPVSAEETAAASPPYRATRMRSKPLVVVGAAASAVGMSLASYGVMTAWGESLCNGFSSIQGEPHPGEPDEFVDDGNACKKGSSAMIASGLVLLFVGVPLIVIGAQRVPAKGPVRATLVPLAVRRGAGLGIRLEL